MLLYYIRVLEEHGDFSEALAQLDTSAKERSIVDRIAIAESRGRPPQHSLIVIRLRFTTVY